MRSATPVRANTCAERVLEWWASPELVLKAHGVDNFERSGLQGGLPWDLLDSRSQPPFSRARSQSVHQELGPLTRDASQETSSFTSTCTSYSQPARGRSRLQ